MQQILALAILLVTVGLVFTRPKGISEGLSALIGAALAIILRLISPAKALNSVVESWNIFLFFLGMMAIAALADQSGAIDFLAQLASSISKGSTLRLFILICITGAAISTLLANGTTAVVLTPIVYTLVLRLSLDPLPFMFATTFIADTASIGLPVSNPINLIISEQTGIDLPHYISAM